MKTKKVKQKITGVLVFRRIWKQLNEQIITVREIRLKRIAVTGIADDAKADNLNNIQAYLEDTRITIKEYLR